MAENLVTEAVKRKIEEVEDPDDDLGTDSTQVEIELVPLTADSLNTEN